MAILRPFMILSVSPNSGWTQSGIFRISSLASFDNLPERHDLLLLF